MKKNVLSILVIVLSFLLGNGSMLVGLIRLIIKHERVLPAVKEIAYDILVESIQRTLYGEPRRQRTPFGLQYARPDLRPNDRVMQTAYERTQRQAAVAAERRMQRIADGELPTYGDMSESGYGDHVRRTRAGGHIMGGSSILNYDKPE